MQELEPAKPVGTRLPVFPCRRSGESLEGPSSGDARTRTFPGTVSGDAPEHHLAIESTAQEAIRVASTCRPRESDDTTSPPRPPSAFELDHRYSSSIDFYY